MNAQIKTRFTIDRASPDGFRIIVVIFCLLCGFLFFHSPGFCEEKNLSFDFPLKSPPNDTHRQYLGLDPDKPFSLSQIKAKVLIIEIFSMYCPICQREAPDVNALYNLIQADPALKNKIKLIGIGVGNSDFEVDVFKEKYKVEFPLFSDPDFSIHKKTGTVRTPHFFGLLLKENSDITVFYSRTGEMTSPEEFLKTITAESHIKELP